MKKIVLTSLMPIVLLSSSAFAECHLKCVSRNPFNGRCIAKVNVCDVGSPADWFNQAEGQSKHLISGLEDAWHQVYGVIPEEARLIINNYTFTIVGAYYGGLEGAALGQGIDQMLARSRVAIAKTKSHVESQPDWKKVIYDKGLDVEVTRDADTVTLGMAAKQELALRIAPLHDQFLECVDKAQDINQGWDCFDVFEDAVNDLVREARRQ